MNINTAEYWDKTWAYEGTDTWRRYPSSFARIGRHIGTGQNVLELGGGVGILANWLQSRGNKVCIVDISPVAIRLAKKAFNVDGIVASVPPIPWEEAIHKLGRIDCIVATEFLEHIDDPAEVVEEARALTSKGIYAVPNNVLGPEDEREHQRAYTSKSFYDTLKAFYENVFIDEYVEIFAIEDKVSAEVSLIRTPVLIGVCDNG